MASVKFVKNLDREMSEVSCVRLAFMFYES